MRFLMTRLLLLSQVLLFGLFFAVPSQAQTQQWREGVHYQRLAQPVRTSSPGKIEVAAFFWYGAGHSFQLEPLMNQWSQNLPHDVALVRIPAIWNTVMQTHAQAYYTAKALRAEQTLHPTFYNALHLQGQRLQDARSIQTLFQQAGIDTRNFTKTFKSFGVASQIKQAQILARSHQLRGVPQFTVGGLYSVHGSTNISQQNMLQIVNFLINKIRNGQ